ncbi:hypothetical protein AK88_05584, partial [Plasmodium fragile]
GSGGQNASGVQQTTSLRENGAAADAEQHDTRGSQTPVGQTQLLPTLPIVILLCKTSTDSSFGDAGPGVQQPDNSHTPHGGQDTPNTKDLRNNKPISATGQDANVDMVKGVTGADATVVDRGMVVTGASVACTGFVITGSVLIDASIKGTNEVRTFTRTYPSRHARSLSELSLYLGDCLLSENQYKNGKHHTPKKGHNDIDDEWRSQEEIDTMGNGAEWQFRSGFGRKQHDYRRPIMQQGNWVDKKWNDWIGKMPFKWDGGGQRKWEERGNYGNPEDLQLDWSVEDIDRGRRPQRRYGDFSEQSYGAREMQNSGPPYSSWKKHTLERYQSRIPHIDPPQGLQRNLTYDQILNIPYTNPLWISKRKAFISFFYHVMYLERKYYDMVNYLNRWFYNLAETNNMPDEYKLKLWEESKRELLYDFECIRRTCENLFRNFVNRKRGKYIWSIPFENLVVRLNKLAHESVVRNKDKWVNILSERVESYTARTNRRHLTHRR